MKTIWSSFWGWYERTLGLQTLLTAVLFSWQLIHLYWLTTHVVAQRLLGVSFFEPSPFIQFLIVLADYAEIPALFSATLLYLNMLRKRVSGKSLIYLLLVNSQWLHLFWITDEYVVETFAADGVRLLPVWLAAIAIGIDYLELPVIYDTIRQSLRYLSGRSKPKTTLRKNTQAARRK